MLKKKQQEVFFVATPNKENRYTFELDVNSAGKDSFGYMSGTYEMVKTLVLMVEILMASVFINSVSNVTSCSQSRD